MSLVNSQNNSTPGRARDAESRVMAEIDRLDLRNQVAELNELGYTILPGILQADSIAIARQVIAGRAQTLAGKSIDLQSASSAEFAGMTYLPYLLYDHAIFAEILLQPKPLALITYLLGESCLLSSMGCYFKGPGESGMLPLHSDNGNGMPAPFPDYAQVANINYALSEYSEAGGALALVPGSHKWARPPTRKEMPLGGEHGNSAAVSMDIAPGDAVIWHGNTWHGSFARQRPGIRMNLAVYFCRQYLQTQEQHQLSRTMSQAHGQSSRYLKLLGNKQPYGWRREGPDYSLMASNPQNLFD